MNTSTTYPPGTKLQYTCEQGYEKGNTSALTCEEDGTWSGGQPLCVEEVLSKSDFFCMHACVCMGVYTMYHECSVHVMCEYTPQVLVYLLYTHHTY